MIAQNKIPVLFDLLDNMLQARAERFKWDTYTDGSIGVIAITCPRIPQTLKRWLRLAEVKDIPAFQDGFSSNDDCIPIVGSSRNYH